MVKIRIKGRGARNLQLSYMQLVIGPVLPRGGQLLDLGIRPSRMRGGGA